jgi:hypothetical protein
MFGVWWAGLKGETESKKRVFKLIRMEDECD